MSVYWDLLQNRASVGSGVSSAVAVRKRPFFSTDHGDTAPLLLICPDRERVVDEAMGNNVFIAYPVYAVYVRGKAAALASAADLEDQLSIRDEIRNAFWTPEIVSIPEICGCEYDPHPAFDLGGLDQQYDVSTQLFLYRAQELRA